MEFEGTLAKWNDDRGFGFIEPTLGGEPIFVHISAFRGIRQRPQVGLCVVFTVEVGEQGKKRAAWATPVSSSRRGVARQPRAAASAPGAASLWWIPVFVTLMILGYVLGRPPRWLPLAYLIVSVVTYLVYYFDKRAASAGARRTPESTLHLFALLGGWPGAMLAQQLLRHKSVKPEFRSVFWATVVLNVAGFVALAVLGAGSGPFSLR